MRMSCPRCGGVGYFSEYNLIQDGICFLCYGKKYIVVTPSEELPNENNTKPAKDLFSKLDDVFKRLENLTEANMVLFQQQGYENTKEFAEFLQQRSDLENEKKQYQIQLENIRK